MKQLFKIAIFLLLLVVLTAEDCSESSSNVSREDMLLKEFASIEEEFLNEELDTELLRAFEKRATQKLNDLYDYLNIYSDTSVSVEFRKQAKQMIQETFYTSSGTNNFYKNLSLAEDSLNTLLYKKGYKNQGNYKSVVDEIVISRNLEKQTITTYKGEIQFLQKEFVPSVLDTIQIQTAKHYFEIIAVKTAKEFGSKSQSVWEVYLGEIR